MKYLLVLLIIIFSTGCFYQKEENIYSEKKVNIKNEIPKEITKKIYKQEDEDKNNKVNQKITKIKEIEKIKNEKNIIETVDIPNNILNTEDLNIKNNNGNTNVVNIKDDKDNTENLINISNLYYSSNIDNIIKIYGKDLGNIENINIGNELFNTQLIDGYLYILIERNNYLNGEYNIILNLNNGKKIIYPKKINFILEQGNFLITNITPKQLKNDISRNIIMQGKGFSKVISIQLSNNIVLENASFNIINDNVMSIIIPKDLKEGEYSLNVLHTQGIYDSNLNINIIK